MHVFKKAPPPNHIPSFPTYFPTSPQISTTQIHTSRTKYAFGLPNILSLPRHPLCGLKWITPDHCCAAAVALTMYPVGFERGKNYSRRRDSPTEQRVHVYTIFWVRVKDGSGELESIGQVRYDIEWRHLRVVRSTAISRAGKRMSEYRL